MNCKKGDIYILEHFERQIIVIIEDPVLTKFRVLWCETLSSPKHVSGPFEYPSIYNNIGNISNFKILEELLKSTDKIIRDCAIDVTKSLKELVEV